MNQQQQSNSQQFIDYANNLILLYSNYNDRTPSNDYFHNITEIYTQFNGAYFKTDTATESQVWYEWRDPEWWFGNEIQSGVGQFVRRYVTEPPNYNYTQLT